MREPLIDRAFVIRLTLLATVISGVTLMIPYPQTRIQVVSPNAVDATQTSSADHDG